MADFVSDLRVLKAVRAEEQGRLELLERLAKLELLLDEHRSSTG